MVYHLALSAGAEIEFGVTVASVSSGNPKPSVVLSTGEAIHADIVIGADGRCSIVRQVVCDYEEDETPLSTGTTVYSGTVLAEQLKDDPKLEQFVKSNEVSKQCLSSSQPH